MANLDTLFDFWNNHCNHLKIILHLGVTLPLSQAIQSTINDLNISNIKIYTQSKIFPTLIYHCDYYFNMGFYNDIYAHWANQHHKTIIIMKYAEFESCQNIVDIPYTLSKIKICKEYLFESHAHCQTLDHCTIYGHQDIENAPVINQLGLRHIFNQLFN